MEAHLHHHQEEASHDNAALHSAEGEHNQPGEKKSVLKKVKDKAKKMKDTITKHGGHGHGHDQISEEEDEEAVNATEVLGAPMDESAFISGTNLPKQTGLDLEKPPGPPEGTYNPSARDELAYPIVEYGPGLTDKPSSPDDRYSRNEPSPKVFRAPGLPLAVSGHDVMNPGQGKTGSELERSSTEAHNPEAQPVLPSGPDVMDLDEARGAEPIPKIGPLVDLVEDPHSPNNRPGEIPLSNYQTKVIDPTGLGGKEADVAPLIDRLDNLHVGDESEANAGSRQEKSYTGTHDQFAPQSAPTVDQFSPDSNPIGILKSSESPFDPAKPESMSQDTITGKISSATSSIADKAVCAKNVVASKIGYGSQHEEGQDCPKKSAPESATEYGYKVPEKLSQVFEKVADAGSAVVSKVQRGGGVEHEGGNRVVKESDKGVSVKGYLAEKFSPGEDDKALSEAIKDAMHRRQQQAGHGKKSNETADLAAGKEIERDALAAGGQNSGTTGVVNRVKGVVSSWLGISSGNQTGQHSLHQEHGKEAQPGGS